MATRARIVPWQDGAPLSAGGEVRVHQPAFDQDALPFADVAFSPDGKTLASGGVDSIVFRWNIEDTVRKTVIATLGGFSTAIEAKAIAFSASGLLATGTVGGQVTLWDVKDWTNWLENLAKRSDRVKLFGNCVLDSLEG